jgi:2-C-methyl-D-erythritol 4-phosphate cytidylyltransferase
VYDSTTTPDPLTVLKEGAERTPSVMEGLRQRLETPILLYEAAFCVCRTAATPGVTPDTVASAGRQ